MDNLGQHESGPKPPDGTKPSTAVGSAVAPRPDDAEVERLRTEVADLRGRLDTRQRHRMLVHRFRAITAAILVALAGFGVVLSVIGIWGTRTVYNTDRWVATVGPLPQDPQVNAAVAAYLTSELQRTLNLQQRVANALPRDAAFLAAPVAGQVRNYLQTTIANLLHTPQFQSLWVEANRRAQPRLVAILENRSQVVSANGDTVTLNLLPIVNNVLADVDRALPDVFGKQITLPTITSGQIPPNLRERIQTQLGVTLPPDFADIKLYNRGALAQVQDAVVLAKRTVVLTVLGTLVVLGLAIGASVHRRRTVLQFGLWLALATVVLTYALRVVNRQLLQNVSEGTYRNGASAALYTIFAGLRERGVELFWLGVVIAVLAYLVGPGRLPTALRDSVVRGTRWVGGTTRSVATGPQLPIWAHRYLDPVRIGGVVIAAIVAVLFSSWTALFVIAVVLIGFEVLVTLLARRGEALGTGEPPQQQAAVPPAPVQG
ncbi:MAG: hypothetical protein ACRDSP_23120 [Pseudonocardiaceae bacterium]